MDLVKKILGVAVFSSILISPDYADGQVLRRKASAGYYYCDNCKKYHAYQTGQRGNDDGTSVRNSVGRELRDAVSTNMTKASTNGLGNQIGNAVQVGEGLKPLMDFITIIDALSGNSKKQEKEAKKPNNYNPVPKK